MTVRVKFNANSPFGDKQEIFENITEVHYNYKQMGIGKETNRVAFESDIHGTGTTQPIEEIQEFEVLQANKLAEDFAE